MARGARWIDLLDPTREELVEETPVELHPRAVELLLAQPEDEQATPGPPSKRTATTCSAFSS